MDTPEKTTAKTVTTLSAADRATVVFIAGLLRSAVLRRAGDQADDIAERVAARLSASATAAAATSPPSSPSPTSSGSASPAGAAKRVVTGTAPTLDEPPPILLSVASAARLLGCSQKAIYHRVAARHIPSSCVVRSGRRVLFHRERLLATVERKAGR